MSAKLAASVEIERVWHEAGSPHDSARCSICRHEAGRPHSPARCSLCRIATAPTSTLEQLVEDGTAGELILEAAGEELEGREHDLRDPSSGLVGPS